ncbi:MAG: CPBP family intramembrane metalloprotease, partial [Methanobrevibacter sp.]|nr:CPBP family intramembrane metalloprotease [Methanobrevibacter sp.]
MTEKNKISKFITFPTTFENYKWYKPILVFIVTAIMYLILNGIITLIFYAIFGQNMISSIVFGGYEVMNTEAGQIYSDLGIIIILPALYVATKVIKDRPLSSYASSRGGFNYRLYFKALLIPIIIYVIFEIINIFTVGIKGTNHFSIPFFIVCIILVPLQCISEEFAFRGLIMQSIGSWVKIPVLTIVIQAIIFAALHGYNNLGVLIIFISGLVMGFFAWKTNG